jgi:hypothetical protein
MKEMELDEFQLHDLHRMPVTVPFSLIYNLVLRLIKKNNNNETILSSLITLIRTNDQHRYRRKLLILLVHKAKEIYSPMFNMDR